MNKWIFLGIGVAVGSAVTLLAVKKHYEQLAYSEINEVRETYKKNAAAKELAVKNVEAKSKLLKDINEDDRLYKEAAKAIRRYTVNVDTKINKTDANKNKKKDRVNYNVFNHPPFEEDLDISDDPYEFTVDHTGPDENNNEPPFVITEEEFASEKLFYDKVLIELYTDGVAVLDENDTIIEEPIEDLIGPDILGRVKTDDNDMIYVRNHARSTDYGLIFTGQSFTENFDPEEGSS